MVRRRFFPWALSGALGLALLYSVGHRSGESRDVPTAPVLQRLRALGDLHTARFEYADVVDHGTYQRPEGMLAALPGADAMARATTENRALLDVRGSVEAGVDLRKLQAERTPTGGLRLILPKPRIYPAQVDARLFSTRRGMFWRDDAIALEAEGVARERLRSAALRQGILDHAKKEAEARVRAFSETLGGKVAEVRFGDA